VTSNYAIWQIIFNCVQLLLTFAVWWSSRNKVTNDRFTQLETSKIKLEQDVKHLKQELQRSKPECTNHQRMERTDQVIFDRLENMHVDIKTLSTTMGKIEGSIEGVKHTGQLINQFLLEQGGKK
jgi:predicted RNase H-like nuclease (RuvC/YqgF family)